MSPPVRTLKGRNLGAWLLACGLIVVATVFALRAPAPPITSGMNEASIGAGPGLWVGVTHGQYSADGSGNPQAVKQARQFLRTSFPVQNQALMG